MIVPQTKIDCNKILIETINETYVLHKKKLYLRD